MIVDELLTDGCIDEVAVVLEVVEVGDVTITVDRNTIAAVGHSLQVATCLIGEVGGQEGLLPHPGIIDGITERRHRSGEDEVEAARGGVVAGDLREDFVAIGVEDAHLVLIATCIDGAFHDVRPLVRKRVIHHDGYAFRPRVHQLNDSSGTRLQLLGKGAVGKVVFVVGIVVGGEDAGAGQSVVVLLPKGSHPGIAQLFGGVRTQVKPHGERRSLLGGIGQQLVLAVP